MRSRPSNGAGDRRSNGFEVRRMKARKATLIRPCTASASARSRARQRAAEQGDERAEHRQDQDPQQHRAFVVPPDAGDLVDRRHRAVRVLGDVENREVGGQMRVDERREGDRDQRELGQRGAAARPPSGRRRRRARPRTARSSAPAPRRARGRGRNGRSRRSWLGDVLPFLPAALLSSAPRRLRAACSARHAWRESCPPRSWPAPPARPRRPRPDPRGTGRARWRSSR